MKKITCLAEVMADNKEKKECKKEAIYIFGYMKPKRGLCSLHAPRKSNGELGYEAYEATDAPACYDLDEEDFVSREAPKDECYVCGYKFRRPDQYIKQGIKNIPLPISIADGGIFPGVPIVEFEYLVCRKGGCCPVECECLVCSEEYD